MIREHFGSRSGLAKLLIEELRWLTGVDRAAPIELRKISRLVFVCRGNICRSAFAAEVARALQFPAVSYGLDTRKGKPADPGMVAAARSLGHDLSLHTTLPLDEYEPLDTDLVAVFELSQLRQVRDRLPRSMSVPLGRWAKPARTYIHDPYMSAPAFYTRSCELIESATRRIVADIHHASGPTAAAHDTSVRSG
jgi:protein-tyrosine phosphatase